MSGHTERFPNDFSDIDSHWGLEEFVVWCELRLVHTERIMKGSSSRRVKIMKYWGKPLHICLKTGFQTILERYYLRFITFPCMKAPLSL